MLSTALQNRLVGTIILVALAVIFLPDILDGEKQSHQDVFVELPQRPQMRAVEKSDEFPLDEVTDAVTRDVEVVTEQVVDDQPEAPVESPIETAEQTDTPTTPSVEEHSLQQQTVVETNEESLLESAGWVVQLGVFRHQKNVQDLLDKLKGAGYRAFSRPIQTSSGELTKVFVGPDLEKDKLEQAMPHLNELTKLQGRITPFKVN